MYIDRVYNADEAMLLQANLLLRGCSMDEVQFFTASRQAALARRSRVHAWDSAMPPMIRQTFGMRNSRRHGVRIPVPATYYSEVPCLPALRPTTDFTPPAFTWLHHCFPHERDARIIFYPEGHRYLLEGDIEYMSVTTLLASFAEARNLADQIEFQSYNAL